MAEEIRWFRCPSRMTRFPLPDPNETILFVAVADVLAALERNPDGLRDVLANLDAAESPIPDTLPEWMDG